MIQTHKTLEFIAIDFETATPKPDSACAVGIIHVKNEEIVEEFYSLIRPPENQYSYFNTKVHGITPQDTIDAPEFLEIFPKIHELLSGKTIVAHNESFDRNVLFNTMFSNGLKISDYNFLQRWECTVRIYRKKGMKRANLKSCCELHDIPLNHHNALSDARACAILYMKHLYPLFSSYER